MRGATGYGFYTKQVFWNTVFDSSLQYSKQGYRTPYILPVFQSKAMILKEKGLLTVEQPLKNNLKSTDVPQTGVEPVRAFQPTGF